MSFQQPMETVAMAFASRPLDRFCYANLQAAEKLLDDPGFGLTRSKNDATNRIEGKKPAADPQNHTLVAMFARTAASANHLLRPICKITDAAIWALLNEFDASHATEDRPSISPDRLLRGSLIQPLYRSARDASWWDKPITACCSAGSLTCPSMNLSGTSRRSAKINRILENDLAAPLDAAVNADEVKEMLSGTFLGRPRADLWLGFNDRLLE
jgi:hypothetical protein